MCFSVQNQATVAWSQEEEGAGQTSGVLIPPGI